MGNRLRVFISTLLSLICLTVLSLHVALCLHYPSPLFAVTLLLNPSLWLFLGLMSMLCTLLLNFRDQRRKLVPALCTTCRPKHELTPLLRKYAERSRRLPDIHQDLTCYCSKRLISRSNCQNDSSVQISTHVAKPNSALVVTKIAGAESSLPITENSSCTREPCSPTSQNQDVQNFSCLLLNQKQSNMPNCDGEEAIVKEDSCKQKNGRLAYCSSNNNQCRLYATNTTSVTRCIGKDQLSNREIPKTFSNFKLRTSEPESGNLSDHLIGSNKEANDDTDSSLSVDRIAVLSSSGAIKKHRTYVNPHSSTTTSRYLTNNSSCTCPVRYYLKYNTRGQVISKSKPIMKCSLIHKTKTPVHLFEVKLKQDDDLKLPLSQEVKIEIEKTEQCPVDLAYDSVSCSSLVPLISSNMV